MTRRVMPLRSVLRCPFQDSDSLLSSLFLKSLENTALRRLQTDALDDAPQKANVGGLVGSGSSCTLGAGRRFSRTFILRVFSFLPAMAFILGFPLAVLLQVLMDHHPSEYLSTIGGDWPSSLAPEVDGKARARRDIPTENALQAPRRNLGTFLMGSPDFSKIGAQQTELLGIHTIQTAALEISVQLSMGFELGTS